MYFLKLLGRPLLEYLQPLFQAYFHSSYHHLHFKQSSTVALRKPGKWDYSVPAVWQPVALLNTLGMKRNECFMAIVVSGRLGVLPSIMLMTPSGLGPWKESWMPHCLNVMPGIIVRSQAQHNEPEIEYFPPELRP